MKHTSSQYPGLLIAGTHSGVGKTTITLGLMSALKEKGYKVQGFKAGPDYIDPSHHTAITQKPSRNLDTWLMSRDVCLELYEHALTDSNIAVIEGVMGLYDGCLDGSELGSTAHLAKILNVPAILVMDAKGMSRSAGAVVLGYKNFDRDVKIQGIILNRVKSERHYNSIKQSIEGNCGIPVLGYLPFREDIALPERHLGLVPSVEQEFSKSTYQKIGNLLSSTVDIDQLISIASTSDNLPSYKKTVFSGINERFDFRIAVAVDEAFNFYYQDNLDLLELYGIELTYFSPLYDKYLPADIDGLYIGGGFPELYANLLASNTTMKESIRKAHKNGVVIYGECGGMMYLLEHMVDFKNKTHEMCGILKGTTRMENKRQGLGYITVQALHDNILCKKGATFKGHEFHWSSLHVPEGTPYAYAISKCDDKKSKADGIFAGHVLGSYTHVHFATDPGLAKHFLYTIAKKI
ncbi:MAG: cobyrinate a,c-diamide synthase [Planctomycetes bacterium]|uniref:cobyrinate a,c-diamide synthase n=1 Tax=Candidatus Wunengus sp. YC65 TaxID=3367701 RepID=UPI001D732D44|nr:cobyrinate a,c-diamide synthase [Planctomycetota bacterium]